MSFKDIFKPLGTYSLSLTHEKQMQFIISPFLPLLLLLPKLDYKVLKKKHFKKVREVPRLLLSFRLTWAHWSRKSPSISLSSSCFQGVSDFCLHFVMTGSVSCHHLYVACLTRGGLGACTKHPRPHESMLAHSDVSYVLPAQKP